MAPQHARAGVTHDRFHLIAPEFLVTVDWTRRAGWFLRSKTAAIQAHGRVILELLAIDAKRVAAGMLATTVNADHQSHGAPFTREPRRSKVGGLSPVVIQCQACSFHRHRFA